MVYVAGTQMVVDGETRHYGDAVPEAEDWVNLRAYVGRGEILELESLEYARLTKQIKRENARMDREQKQARLEEARAQIVTLNDEIKEKQAEVSALTREARTLNTELSNQPPEEDDDAEEDDTDDEEEDEPSAEALDPNAPYDADAAAGTEDDTPAAKTGKDAEPTSEAVQGNGGTDESKASPEDTESKQPRRGR